MKFEWILSYKLKDIVNTGSVCTPVSLAGKLSCEYSLGYENARRRQIDRAEIRYG